MYYSSLGESQRSNMDCFNKGSSCLKKKIEWIYIPNEYAEFFKRGFLMAMKMFEMNLWMLQIALRNHLHLKVFVNESFKFLGLWLVIFGRQISKNLLSSIKSTGDVFFWKLFSKIVPKNVVWAYRLLISWIWGFNFWPPCFFNIPRLFYTQE